MNHVVIIPTYNERENIVKLVEKIISLKKNIHILIIDDNSPDGTGEIADNLVKNFNIVNVIHRESKLGLGSAYITGFKWAFDRNYDIIFTMDADFSHNPEYLPAFLEDLKEYDLVIGSRYILHGGIVGWPWQRNLISKCGNIYANTVTGINIKDCTSGFMGFRSEVLKNIGIDQIKAEGYSFLIELKYKTRKKNYKIIEIPIIFIDRKAGKSKISKRIIFEAFYIVFLFRIYSFVDRIRPNR